MIDLRSPAWWAAFTAAVGTIVTVVVGPDIGHATETVIAAFGGLIVALYVHGFHRTRIAETNAAAVIGSQKSMEDVVAKAAGDAIREHLASMNGSGQTAAPAQQQTA